MLKCYCIYIIIFLNKYIFNIVQIYIVNDYNNIMMLSLTYIIIKTAVNELYIM